RLLESTALVPPWARTLSISIFLNEFRLSNGPASVGDSGWILSSMELLSSVSSSTRGLAVGRSVQIRVTDTAGGGQDWPRPILRPELARPVRQNILHRRCHSPLIFSPPPAVWLTPPAVVSPPSAEAIAGADVNPPESPDHRRISHIPLPSTARAGLLLSHV